jgi:hypothetical protein
MTAKPVLSPTPLKNKSPEKVVNAVVDLKTWSTKVIFNEIRLKSCKIFNKIGAVIHSFRNFSRRSYNLLDQWNPDPWPISNQLQIRIAGQNWRPTKIFLPCRSGTGTG